MKSLSLIVGTVIVIGGIIVAIVLNNKTDAPSNNNNTAAVTNSMIFENINSATTNTTTNQSTNTNTPASAPARYVNYSSSTLATAQQSGGQTVLYFHANWCPVCQALEPSIKRNVSDLPEGLTILKVDYDRETALKQQYGVTYQHTFVQVDANGNKLKLWSGSTDARDIADNLI